MKVGERKKNTKFFIFHENPQASNPIPMNGLTVKQKRKKRNIHDPKTHARLKNVLIEI